MRNITGCPVQGLDADELFDCTPIVEEAAAFFYGDPRVLEPAAQAQVHDLRLRRSLQHAGDQLHRAGRCVHDGREGFAVLVGGGLSSVPRIARDLGVFVPQEEAIEMLAAITDVWREDLRYRVSRVKARLKFMVDDVGPEGMRERVEEKLGRRLEDFTLPPLPGAVDHLGVHAQKQDGLLLHRRSGAPRPRLAASR